MAVAVSKQTLKDSGVSVHGMARRNQRELAKFQKVEGVIAHGPMMTAFSKAVVSKLAKSKQPQASKPVTTPKAPPKPLEKAAVVQPKAVSMPKPVKVEAKKVVAHNKKPRTDRVAKLIASPERTLVSPQMIGKTHPAHTQQLEPWSEQQVESYHMAREFDNDRYLNYQDNGEIGTILYQYRTKANGKRVKTKAKRFIERNVALHNTLERLATFKSVSHLTDDQGEYEVRHIVSRNYVTTGGVRFTLGFKKERVIVRCNSTSATAENRGKLDRHESIKSRTFTPAIVGPVTEVLEELDTPPWTDYALDAVRTAADGIARGYASLEEEYDHRGYLDMVMEYIPLEDGSMRNIPRGVNVSELPSGEQAKRNSYMNGLAYIPFREPHYLVDYILKGMAHYSGEPLLVTALATPSSNDEPEPTTPAPAVAQIPDWTSLEGDALDAELSLCFQALIDKDAAAYVEGHFEPATLRRLHTRHGTTYEQWTKTFTARKNRGVLIRQHYDKLAWRAKERKAFIKHETATRGKVHGYRKKNVFIKMKQKKDFRMMESLRLSRERHEKMVESHIQSALQRMEQTFPSDPRSEGERYDEWLIANTSDRVQEDWEGLQYTLRMMDARSTFSYGYTLLETQGEPLVMDQSASYRKHKTMPIPKVRSLTRPEDNIHLDLHPPTGAVQATEPTVDIVGQDKPDFLIARDVVVPFTAGMNILTEVFSPLKGIMQRRSHRILFGLSAPLPAFG